MPSEKFFRWHFLYRFYFTVFKLYVTQNGISSSKLSIGGSAAGLLAGVARGAVGVLGAWLG